MAKTFSHSGARGDIIYGLPTIRALGGGILHIKKDPTCYKSRPLSDKDIDWFKELLCTQHYIKDVKSWEDGLRADFNLDKFRDGYTDFISLAKLHLMAFNVYTDLSVPWIETSRMEPKYKADIVINRSERYHGSFDWGELVGWQDKCIFIGLEQEYREFMRMTGLSGIGYSGECSYKEIAETISGSKLFIGNQSFPFSLAEGMKHPRVLEVLPLAPNCLLDGKHRHTRLTQNVLRHYVLGEPLVGDSVLSYYQPNNYNHRRVKDKLGPTISFIIPCMDNLPIDFIDRAVNDGDEVVTPSGSGKTFEERANTGAERAIGEVLCVVDTRQGVDYEKASRLAYQLKGKEGLMGSYLNLSFARPYMAGEYVAVSRRVYEECGLFNLNMVSGELNYFEMNLRYTNRKYACRSGGGVPKLIDRDDNFDRNARYIKKVYGVVV